ncbi:MAG: glutamate--tRNA ligase, partial [Alphaproteobacteria bacterium]|nr:glutamate--tRNA ligase [Alphaproteobacteria bacterium]
HHNGTFLLRIEDTDRARSTQGAVDALLDGIKWLGLEWDGEPIFQFARMHRHAEVAHELIARGKAYYCQCTPEELEKMRAGQKEKGLHVGYDRRCRDKGHASGAVRIKAPADGREGNDDMLVSDAVQGDVRVPLAQLDDMVLLRADGTPTYMLSVVVDDHDMAITHVIRGDDHLNNTFRQRMIYDAMGWPTPVFAHIPMIHGADGSKLSKRHGAVGLEAYRDMGYLPEAMRNYLLRLGWGHGDTEIISTEEAINLFALEDIGRSPSRMDFAKLANLNAHYMRACGDDDLMARLSPFLEQALGEQPDETGLKRVKAGLHDLKERAETLIELAHAGLFYVRRRPLIPDEAADKVLDGAARQLLGDMRGALAGLESFTAETVETALKSFAAEKGLKLGKVAMPLRCALTGTTNSPSIFHVAEILERDETLARLDDITKTK